MHEWITDNEQTPHLIVDAGAAGVEVPRQYVKDGKIVLNVGHAATHALELGNEWIEFSARFSGVNYHVRIPLQAVLGIYARETGEGMVFNESDRTPEPPGAKPTSPVPEDQRRARLKVVK
jgi:stringent starvation protein B